jgi:hypothetical protein
MYASTLKKETILERGQTACLLKEEHLAVLSAAGETLLNQAFSLPRSRMVSDIIKVYISG